MAHVMVSTAQIALAGAGLVCVRGGREVFSGIDFSLRSGDSLVLTGFSTAFTLGVFCRMKVGRHPSEPSDFILSTTPYLVLDSNKDARGPTPAPSQAREAPSCRFDISLVPSMNP